MEKDLPKGWTEVQLIELLESLETGTRPKGGVQGILEGIPSIGGEHLNSDGGFKFNSIKYVPFKFAASMNRGKIREKDILIVKDGATTGKTSFVDINFPFDQAFVNEHVFLCRPAKQISSKCLYYFLRSNLGQDRVMSNFAGAAQGGINTKFSNNTLISLPPLPEQQRIVARLDTLFGQLDRIKTSMERIPQLLKDFRQKVLTQAVTGKLTEEWREERELETMKDYLALIRDSLALNSKTIGKRPKQNDTPFSDELPVIPISWVWTRLVNIAEVIGGVTKGRKLDAKQTIYAPYLRVANVQDGYLDLKVIKEIEVLPSDLNKYELLYGDILFTEGGDRDKLGRGTIWRNEVQGCIHQNHIFRARVSMKFIIPEYLSFFTKGDIAKKYFFESASQTTNLASINLTTLSNVPIALPTLEEQQEIVRRVESLFAKADQIEASYQKLKEKMEQLPQALLAKAFRGQLVEQLPTDGDARDLLDQIKKAKAGLEKGGKSKKLGKEEPVRMVAEDGARYGKK